MPLLTPVQRDSAYQQPLDPDVPVVNMDEQSVTLRGDIRDPHPAKSGQVKRVDNEYKRNGITSLFLFTAALSGWRRVSVRERRTAADWTEEAERLCSRLEIVYTPKQGSWLNIAEIELSVLTRQCLCRRIPNIEILHRETQAWEKRRNSEAKQVDCTSQRMMRASD